MIKLLFLLFLMPSLAAFAMNLPHNLSPSDFDRVVQVLGEGGVSRLMRSAEAYPTWPGIQLGVDLALTPSRDLQALGDGTGSFPSLIPTPRLFLAKGLPDNFEIILNYFSDNYLGTLGTAGAMLKWSFASEQDQFLSAATYFGYTHLHGLHDAFNGNDVEAGVYVSKDYVRIRPYLGGALCFAHGDIPASYSPLKTSGWDTAIHFFVGMEVELPVDLSIQLDWIHGNAMGSLSVGYVF